MEKSMESHVRELIDRQRCHEVLTRYCRGIDRADVELLKTVYWEDARDEHNVFEGSAMEYVEWIGEEIRNWFDSTMHMIGNVHMDYHGDVVYAETYFLAYHKVNRAREKVEAIQGPGYLARFAWDAVKDRDHVFICAGRYLDRLERRNGEWRIARRQVVTDWNENWPSMELSSEGIFPALMSVRGCHGSADPVYRNVPSQTAQERAETTPSAG